MFEIEQDYDLCAEAENGKQDIELSLRHQPDLIILDLSMPVMNGLEAAHEFKKLLPDVPIILFTQHADLGNPITRNFFHIARESKDQRERQHAQRCLNRGKRPEIAKKDFYAREEFARDFVYFQSEEILDLRARNYYCNSIRESDDDRPGDKFAAVPKPVTPSMTSIAPAISVHM
jgi:CheY-like chemotaxis protein